MRCFVLKTEILLTVCKQVKPNVCNLQSLSEAFKTIQSAAFCKKVTFFPFSDFIFNSLVYNSKTLICINY